MGTGRKQALEPKDILAGRYEIQSKLGQGGFATTWLAWDRELERQCVIKALSFQRMEEWKSLELFEREAAMLKNLSHPLIPEFIAFLPQEESLYLVQEYIPGQSLKQMVEAGAFFQEAEIMRIALAVCSILDYLHQLSPPVIHRDIKPGNILLSPDRQIHLIDFGAVQATLHHLTLGGSTIIGTFGYMPPEQFDGRAVPASDIYSLGMTLLYALSHREPGQMEKEALKVNFRPYVNISDGLATILEKMVEPDWKQRYQRVAELEADLKHLLVGERIRPAVLPAPKKAVLPLVAGGVACLAVAGGIAFLFLSPGRELPQPRAEISAVPPVATVGTVSGQLLFDGKPVTAVTQVEPRFWFRDEDKNSVPTPQVDYKNGNFRIQGLYPGRFGMAVDFDSNEANPLMYPGDLRSWQTFVITGQPPPLKIELQRLIHLLSPQDNGKVIEGWEQACEKKAFPSPVKFSWKSLGPGTYYDYDIDRVSCKPYKTLEGVAKGTLMQTEIALSLAPNPPGEFYELTLYARRHGRRIGMLMTHGANGHGWDLRFRVQ